MAPKYAFDEMLKEANITPIRLPPYFCIYNPIELIWSKLKNKFREANISPADTDATVRSLSTIVEKEEENWHTAWKNSMAHVVALEEKQREVNQEAQERGLRCLVNEHLVITVADSDSDSEWSDPESEYYAQRFLSLIHI